MTSSQLFFNTHSTLNGVTLTLDIDLKLEVIKSLYFDSANQTFFETSFNELTQKLSGQKLDLAESILRSECANERKLANGQKAIAPLGLSLLKLALEKFKGESTSLSEEKDYLCLCYGVSKKDVEEFVLKDKNFELKELITSTKASSACGTCKIPLLSHIEQVRLKHGLIKGLDHSRSQFDEHGHWIKIAGLYPGPLLIKLDELKEEWMKREEIIGKYEIFLKNIEGFHLEIEVHGANQAVRTSLISALNDFYQSKLGILFFLH